MTPIGVAVMIIGIFLMILSYDAPIFALVISTLLGSAAALLIGSANVQPAHLMLAFVGLTIFSRRQQVAEAVRGTIIPEPGFWLGCAVIYGVASGYFLPRILAGYSQIFPVGTTFYEDTGGSVPLGPTSGNITQSIYLMADLVCFTVIRSYACNFQGMKNLSNALTAYAAVNIVFAIIDFSTFETGTTWLLGFIRNAQYTLHVEELDNGMKRIAGSFTEASAFSHATLGAFGFTGTMWLCGRSAILNGTLAIISLTLLVLSTSTTGLIGSAITTVILYATAVRRSSREVSGRNSAILLIAGPFVAAAMTFAVALSPQWSSVISGYVDSLVLTKSVSQSGIERGSWNSAAWSNFLASSGLGVGLGTERASSLPLALLSNVGIPGTLAYAAFLWNSLAGRRTASRTRPSDIRLGARNAALALLTADATSGTLVDQGLLFYILAAIACAEPDRKTAADSRF